MRGTLPPSSPAEARDPSARYFVTPADASGVAACRNGREWDCRQATGNAACLIHLEVIQAEVMLLSMAGRV